MIWNSKGNNLHVFWKIFLLMDFVYIIHSLSVNHFTYFKPESMNGYIGIMEMHSQPNQLTNFQSNKPNRRDSLPVIHVRGTYYDVGYNIGRTFMSLIHINVMTSKILNNVYIPLYRTPNGKQVYDQTLEAVQIAYPQYIRELEGMADGADVPFYKLFLLHLDDILPNVVDGSNTDEGQGCSTVILNCRDQIIIGHNEDAFKEILSNVYIAHVRITEIEPNEVFTAFCYAGLLPGYAMGYNQYLAFSINIIGAKNLASGKIPRTFATRAILGVDSMEKVEHILRFRNGGLADAISINLAFLQKDTNPILYNIEASPTYPPSNESAYSIVRIEPGQQLFHCNRLLHLNVPEEQGSLIESSDNRQSTKDRLPPPKNKLDVINIIGDNSQKNLNIFRNEMDEPVITLASAIFDFVKRTWSIYTNNPKTNEPIAVFSFYNEPLQ